VRSCLDQPDAGSVFKVHDLIPDSPAGLPASAAPIRRALLLVGSPRTRKSTSASLAGYLFDQLAARSIQTDTVYLHTVLRSPEKMQALFSALDEADLVLLAFPLYVDSLPAPVIEALERIAARRAQQEPGRVQYFAALANCGFPEAAHNTIALEICRVFARQAGFAWAGWLAMGAGEMVHGEELAGMDGRAYGMRSALEMAAGALADGKPIPAQAQALLAKPVIPAWLYRLMGMFGWRQQAKKFGAQGSLRRRTYQEIK
jgi:multimeric flavodoxin WrbA